MAAVALKAGDVSSDNGAASIRGHVSRHHVRQPLLCCRKTSASSGYKSQRKEAAWKGEKKEENREGRGHKEKREKNTKSIRERVGVYGKTAGENPEGEERREVKNKRHTLGFFFSSSSKASATTSL
jgi:hypothetical protein